MKKINDFEIIYYNPLCPVSTSNDVFLHAPPPYGFKASFCPTPELTLISNAMSLTSASLITSPYNACPIPKQT
jgi:hypothetical protein